MKRIAVLSIAILLALLSCKKYEEGPAFSLRSKKARLAGVWRLSKWTIDGTEQDLNTVSWSLIIYASGNYEKNISYNMPPLPVTSDIEQGSWEFDEKKEHVLFLDAGNTAAVPQEIIKLKNRDLRLRMADGGVTEEYHYAFISE